MRSRLGVMLAVLVLCGATSASADVSLTEQRTFAQRSSTRAYGDGVVGAALVGGAPRLVDAVGLEWFINGEVTYATESSGAGAASDAVFANAVSATTAGGGTHLAILADAFDGYAGLKVGVDGGALASYTGVSSYTTDCGGRQYVLPVMAIGGVEISRKVYVPSTDSFARFLNIVHNPTGSARTVVLQLVSNLGSDAGTRIDTTSDGDATAEASDLWVTSYQAFDALGASTDPRLGHVFQGTGGTPVQSIDFVNGDDTPVVNYSLTVPAGATMTVMNLVTGQASKALASTKAAELASAPPAIYACMAAGEQTQLANFPTAPLPSNSLTITTPTTAPTMVGSAPYLGVAGVVNGVPVSSVSWSSNRGFAGTAQGTSAWAAPAVPLLQGTNVITVSARNSAGQNLSDTLTVTLNELTYHLPEGSTGTFFTTDVLIANPNPAAVQATLSYFKPDGTVIAQPPLTLAPLSRTTVNLNTVPGLESTAVSTIVSSPGGAPLVVERTMLWDSTYYGSHGATAIDGPANTFYFGEGSQGYFDTYLLLSNTNSTDADVTVRYLEEYGAPVVKNYTVPARSRFNVYAGSHPELVNTSFGMMVTSPSPIAAERALYFGSPLFNGGHDSAGVTFPTTQWYFAEGASGPFFDTYYLLANPGTTAANVTFEYQLMGGGTVTVNRVVPAEGRLTVNPEGEHASLANAAFSLRVTSDQAIIAERSMYWGGTYTQWFEAHNSFGVNEPAMKWGLAEGRVGTNRNFETYILIGNPSTTDSTVRVTFLRTNGGTVTREWTVAAKSRFNIQVDAMVPELVDEQFGAVVEVISGGAVVVERSLYNTVNGVMFAAGTNVAAVRLP